MRLIAYSEKFPLPFIDDIANPSTQLRIIGGQWLDGGARLALHCVYRKPGTHDSPVEYLAIVPVGPFPQDLEEAMEERQREIDRGRNLFHDIVLAAREQEHAT